MPVGTLTSKFLARALIVFLISGVALYWLQKNRKEKQEEGRRAAEDAAETKKVKESIGKLGATYNAVIDWRAGDKSVNQSAPQYSIDVEGLLVRQDRRPILFVGELHDVLSGDGAPQCIFDTIGGFSWVLRLRLACTPEQAKLLTESRNSNSLQRFAVVAQVTSATKLEQGPVGSSEDQVSAPEFRVNGRCVDFLFVGSYLYELELLPPSQDVKP